MASLSIPLPTVLVPVEEDYSLPELPYSPSERKNSIGISCTILIFDSCILPTGLFYSLWFGTSLSAANVFTIITGVSGVIELLHFFWRIYALLKKDPFRRPIGSRRGWLDSFQFVYILVAAIAIAELTYGTAYSTPLVRLCSMPVPSLMFVVAIFDLCLTIGSILDCQLPIRMSSMAKGEEFRPGIYFLIEDIVAVDGNAGRPYRAALSKRYCASIKFRSMLVKLSLFWSLSALFAATAFTAVIYTAPEVVAFGVGWVAPFIWIAVLAPVTILWVRYMLVDEKESYGRGPENVVGTIDGVCAQLS